MATVSGIVVATGGAPGSNRRTLLDVVDELARPVNAADSDVRAMAADAFRSAVRRINRKGLWPWEVLEEEITINNSKVFSTATGVIKKPLSMHFLDASAGTRMRSIPYIPYERFIEINKMDFNAGGEFLQYTIPNLYETGQIRWFPQPSTTSYAKFTYYRVTPAPRNETEVLEIPEFVTDAYVAVAWHEFLKRLPSQQRPFELGTAKADARQAFRELSAHVNMPGDRSRQVSTHG
jgi:hypothetical protein